MHEVAPDTRVRVSPAEMAGLTFAGSPATVRVRFLSDLSEAEWPQPSDEPPAPPSLPDLAVCEWEAGGATVAAELDVVAARTCSLDEIRSYRLGEYDNAGASDEAAFRARARAEEVIERECRRHIQPVLRACVVDRPTCRTTTQAMGDDYGCAHDVRRVARATTAGGSPVAVTVGGDRCTLGVSALAVGQVAEVALVCGLDAMWEAHDVVVYLASWFLVPRQGAENATSTTTDYGTTRMVVGGVGGAATSLPEVNAFIQRHRLLGLRVG